MLNGDGSRRLGRELKVEAGQDRILGEGKTWYLSLACKRQASLYDQCLHLSLLPLCLLEDACLLTMPYIFHLPTTSYLTFQDLLSSTSHPSLPTSATTTRTHLRNTLKQHKRLPTSSQSTHLTQVLPSLQSYIPHLLALDAGLSTRPISDEEVQVNLEREPIVEWRTCLSPSPVPGRDSPRVKLQSFEYELLFALLTLGETYYLLARAALHTLYNATTPTEEQRTSAIQNAMRHFLSAHGVFSYVHTRSAQLPTAPPVADIAAPTLGALAALALAEATLIAVLKDDPYPAAVVQERNKNDKEWMYKAASIPKVRAHLFARLCIASADHAARGLAMLGKGRVNEDLREYLEGLRGTARGKACRFFGIDAEIEGKTGEAVAWLQGARREMGFVGEDQKARGLGRLKKKWEEGREDRRVEKGGEWGSDAGRFEEGRVVDMLIAKWERINNTVSIQVVPPSEPLIAKMPSGREYHSPKPWVPPDLDATSLASMRAPPDPEAERYRPGGDDSDSDAVESEPVGAFPGTASDYSGRTYY